MTLTSGVVGETKELTTDLIPPRYVIAVAERLSDHSRGFQATVGPQPAPNRRVVTIETLAAVHAWLHDLFECSTVPMQSARRPRCDRDVRAPHYRRVQISSSSVASIFTAAAWL